MKTTINSLGILSATIGAFLVWRYLTEINFADKDKYLQGQGVLNIPSPSKEDNSIISVALRDAYIVKSIPQHYVSYHHSHQYIAV